MTTTPDTQGGTPATSKDRLYALRQPKRAFRIWADHPTSSYKLQRLVAHMVDHELAARLTGHARAN